MKGDYYMSTKNRLHVFQDILISGWSYPNKIGIGVSYAGLMQTTDFADNIFIQGPEHVASKMYAFAQGKNNNVNGKGAFASGEGLITSTDYQHVLGKYNKNVADALLVVGCGTSDSDRKNAIVVNKSGLVEFPSMGDSTLRTNVSGYSTYLIDTNNSNKPIYFNTGDTTGGAEYIWGTVPSVDGSENIQSKLFSVDNITVGTAKKVSKDLTISLNGTPQAAYNGSAHIDIDISPTMIGAAPSGHSHNYAGSSSPSGPANYVANNLTITVDGGATNGAVKYVYNGSAEKTFTISAATLGVLPLSGGTLTGPVVFNGNVSLSKTFSINHSTGGMIFEDGSLSINRLRIYGGQTNTDQTYVDESSGKTYNYGRQSIANRIAVQVLVANGSDDTGLVLDNRSTSSYVEGKSIRPLTDATLSCGSPGFRWTNVYTDNVRLKNNGAIISLTTGNSSKEILCLSDKNNVVVGYDPGTSGTNLLILKGKEVRLSSSSGTVVTSDKRVKTNVHPIDQKYIDAFMNLDVVNYNYIKSPDINQVGLIYQDVKEVFESHGINNFAGISDPVDEKSEDDSLRYGSLQYDAIQNIQMKITQDNYREINKLKEENDRLKRKIDELKTLIDNLSSTISLLVP